MRRGIEATEEYAEVIQAVATLFERLRLQTAFVGNVALAGWLGGRMERGPVDVLAMITPERMRQVPMMASNNGFQVDSTEVEAALELDLVPMRYGGIRVHVLMATNALYGQMLAHSVEASVGETTVRIVNAEDLALLLLMAEDDQSVQTMVRDISELDVDALNRKLVSIGLAVRRVAR